MLFSHNGDVMVTSSDDETVCLWSTTSWETLCQLKLGFEVYCSGLSEDGKFLACGGGDGRVLLFRRTDADEKKQDQGADSMQFELVHTVRHDEDSPVNSVDFSPGGNIVVTASHDGTARVWDMEGKLVEKLQDHRYAKTNDSWFTFTLRGPTRSTTLTVPAATRCAACASVPPASASRRRRTTAASKCSAQTRSNN